MKDLTTSIEENQTELERLNSLNEENAASKMMLMGNEMFTHSLGSYDAIAELNVKIDQGFGGYREIADATSSIT